VENLESNNINQLWIKNIYENIKKLEELFRRSSEGCSSLIEYLMIPISIREREISEAMYKNLKLIRTEMKLLVADCCLHLQDNKYNKYLEKIDALKKIINNKAIFITESYSARLNMIIGSQVTQYFQETLDFFFNLRVEIMRDIKSLLYAENQY